MCICRFGVIKFHNIEFWCSDAVNTSRRFTWGFGMMQVAKSDLSTGNKHYASVVTQSNDVVFVFTAPYNNASDQEGSNPPHPGFDQQVAHKFIAGTLS